MLDYREDAVTGVAEITVAGHVTTEEFDRVAAKLDALIATHGKVRVLEMIENFEGMDATAFWHDLKFSLRHLNDFSRCAVVSDVRWIDLWSQLIGPFITCEVKHFEPAQHDEARAWLERIA